MQTSSSSNVSTSSHYKIYGTVRDQFQKPMTGTVIEAFDKDIRSEQLLGKAKTNEAGYYEISYSHRQFAATDKNAADVFIRVFDKKEQLLKESDVHFNAAPELQIDIDLAAQAYSGPSEFEQIVATITPFTGELPLSSLTENSQIQDISFLVSKTGLPKDKIENIVMAFRFNTMTKIASEVFYGLLREGIPAGMLNNIATAIARDDFETMVSTVYNGLVHTDIGILMNALQKAIDENIIPYNIIQQLQTIQGQFSAILKQTATNAASGGSISSELFSLTCNSVPLSNYLTDKQDI
ncbi:MAG: hypothetical protein ACRDE2_03680, partial [Chitinophagaceae bacterium]